MNKEPTIMRTPHSTDKIKIKQNISKSLSKYSPNTPSPNTHHKVSQKQVRDLGVIKQKIKKKVKDDKKPKEKSKHNQQFKNKQVKENNKNKKKPNFSICLKELKPINLEKQKQLFFSSGFSKNPFFVYNNISDIQDEEYKEQFKYDCPHGDYLNLAMKILDKGAEVKYWDKVKLGITLTLEETQQAFNQYILKHGFSELLTYQFAENTVSTTSVVHNNVGGVSTVIIGLPIRYNNLTIQGVLNHQIGTHFIRKHNDRGQKWYKERKKFNLDRTGCTQPTYSICHGPYVCYMPSRAPPLLFRAALLYLSCYLASKVSFVELFKMLEKHQPDPQMRWRECVRVKRGIADTTKPGGMYKDQIYFMGAINVLRNRHRINFNEFHCGKFSVDDYFKLKEKGQIGVSQKTKLPHFLSDMSTYLKCLNYIAEYNEIK